MKRSVICLVIGAILGFGFGVATTRSAAMFSRHRHYEFHTLGGYPVRVDLSAGTAEVLQIIPAQQKWQAPPLSSLEPDEIVRPSPSARK